MGLRAGQVTSYSGCPSGRTAAADFGWRTVHGRLRRSSCRPVSSRLGLLPLVGRASMDMLTIDLRNQPNAKIGDKVVLWGDSLPIEEVAIHADPIPYELLCGVHKRLQFVEQN